MARPGRIASVGELQWVVPVEIGERTAAEGLLVAAELGLERGTGAAVANTRIPRARGEIEGIASCCAELHRGWPSDIAARCSSTGRSPYDGASAQVRTPAVDGAQGQDIQRERPT
jgi:hypothetical protein